MRKTIFIISCILFVISILSSFIIPRIYDDNTTILNYLYIIITATGTHILNWCSTLCVLNQWRMDLNLYKKNISYYIFFMIFFLKG